MAKGIVSFNIFQKLPIRSAVPETGIKGREK